MKRILISLRFYIGVILFGFAMAFMMPTMVKCKQAEQSKTILQVIRHPDTTFSVIMQERAYDGLYENELDSILNTLKQ